MQDLNTTLAQLAQKLSTTIDHVWATLIKQAAVQFWIDLFQILLCVAACTGLFLLHRRFLKRDQHGDDFYYNNEGLAPIMVIGAGILVIITIITLICNISEMITVSQNPEYWALKKVLEALR